jgi:hypothetical protein
MGQPVKLSDRNKEWFVRRQRCKDRLLNVREEREYFLIVCEGIQTEPNYFEAFRKQLPRETVDIVIEGEGMNTLSLVERAEALCQKRSKTDVHFDQVWVVFDRDSFEPDDFDNAINKAESKKMFCAWSNEAFELWYVLHFEYRVTAMPRTEYREKLKELLGEIYAKNDPGMYYKLQRLGNQQQAIKWAKELEDDRQTRQTPPSRANPCTIVYRLVEALNRFKTPEETEQWT